MQILLKFVIDCDPDAAWRAVHSPRAVAELYGPMLDLEPLVPSGLPTAWSPGDDVPVQLSALGVPMGRQLIHASERIVDEPGGRVRIFRDSGIPLTGPLASLDVWDHQMAISPAPGEPGKTLWRDRLVIGGPTAPALWPVLWGMWQWRAARIRALAPTWAHDPETAEEGELDSETAKDREHDDLKTAEDRHPDTETAEDRRLEFSTETSSTSAPQSEAEPEPVTDHSPIQSRPGAAPATDERNE